MPSDLDEIELAIAVGLSGILCGKTLTSAARKFVNFRRYVPEEGMPGFEGILGLDRGSGERVTTLLVACLNWLNS